MFNLQGDIPDAKCRDIALRCLTCQRDISRRSELERVLKTDHVQIRLVVVIRVHEAIE